jgi:enterochelin esterase-like enzyme
VEAAAAQRDEIVVALEDPRARLRAVRLRAELFKRQRPPEFVRDRGGTWRLVLPWPRTVDRLEYLLELEAQDRSSVLVCDPSNPLRAPGPFGDKSVLELPRYRPPAWVGDDEAPTGSVRRLRLRSRRLRGNVRGVLWSPHGAEPREPLPLLVVHDGPEFARYSLLLRLLESSTAELELPPLRAALLAPPASRDAHYSASAAYARALALELLPALDRAAPRPDGRETRVGMGASLGALAMLHAHRTHPALFGGLFLQSGSYFRQRFDKQEAGFVRFRRVSRFAGRVLSATDWAHPIPIAMTCGSIEENMANNRAMRNALSSQGYDVAWRENRDGHNWIAWRDTFETDLLALLQRVWA